MLYTFLTIKLTKLQLYRLLEENTYSTVARLRSHVVTCDFITNPIIAVTIIMMTSYKPRILLKPTQLLIRPDQGW